MKHYAIETIGNGQNTRYVVKQIFRNGTAPAINKVFRTVGEAARAALLVGIEVEAVGDLYEIIGIAG